MYGTLAFMRTLPGQRPELAEHASRYGRHRIPDRRPSASHVPVAQPSGSIVNYLYELDRDAEEAITLVVFDDKAAYQRNAASPEQHERYLGYRALLETDPEWHDGEITPFVALVDRETGGDLYGTVVRFDLLPGGEPALEEYLSRWRSERPMEEVPGGVGSWLLRPDEEPLVAYVTAVFESKRYYVENAANPVTDQQYRLFREWLSQDPQWFDGHVRAFQRF